MTTGRIHMNRECRGFKKERKMGWGMAQVVERLP
jgi:hypothetical protein